MTIKGYVDHIIYQNAENGYTVLVFIDDGDEVTCTGYLRNIDPGETLELEGDYVDNPQYGLQFKVETFRAVAPEDAMSVERYLASGAIKGIGKAMAAKIVKKFGEDTIRIMEEEPERLIEIKGISERIARDIATQVEEKRELRDAMIFLQQYGITNQLAVKIYQQYGIRTYTILKENPYQLAEDIRGVGFRLADAIAEKIGIHTDSDYRIRSGLLYALLQASADGHIYLPEEELLRRGSELLGIAPDKLRGQLDNLMMDRKVVMKRAGDEILVYATTYYYAELTCARILLDLDQALQMDGFLPAVREEEERRIRKLEEARGLQLDELQRKAVLDSLYHGVFILSGGPGTGKTTTINMMIAAFEEEGLDILLAAPTGRAAKRMTEATGYEARTIHRMLELNGASLEDGGTASFQRNQENPLEADVVIIDEMSMVDVFLFQALLKAIAPGTRLILVGDMNQLPSVGPGEVLHDLIASETFETVILTKIFRQAEESDIVMNAHRIHRGEQIPLNNQSKDFFFLPRENPEQIYLQMVQMIRERLPKYVHAPSSDIQILTPMRKGPFGVEQLNKVLQQHLNPPQAQKKEHAIGEEKLFRVGDKVMQIRNNYQLEWEIVSKYGIPIDQGVGIFNGDMGTVVEINDHVQEVVVEFDEKRRVTYPFVQLDELELAYAITVHKSQGSEYPAVLMPLVAGPRQLFNRNLLYTAITRARNCVVILGVAETVQEMIRNERESQRYSSLDQRIREIAVSQEL